MYRYSAFLQMRKLRVAKSWKTVHFLHGYIRVNAIIYWINQGFFIRHDKKYKFVKNHKNGTQDKKKRIVNVPFFTKMH